MQSTMTLSLILPTINERENLRLLIPELWQEVPQLEEIIVVDDNSTDGSRELVRDLGARDPRVRLIDRRVPRGLASALEAGIEASHGALVGWMDADRAMSPRSLASLWRAVE